MIPIRIQKTENNRADGDLGTLSPYPTVVMEINDHQQPLIQPLTNDDENSPAFPPTSINQTKKPETLYAEIIENYPKLLSVKFSHSIVTLKKFVRYRVQYWIICRECHMRSISPVCITQSVCIYCHATACLSGTAKLARRQRGEKKWGPRKRGRKLDHHAARFKRGGSAVVVFAHFFLIFLYNYYVY